MMTAELLMWLAPAIAFGAAVIGLAAVGMPRLAARGFGIETQGSGLSYVRITGARDVFIGVTVFTLWWSGESVSLGIISLGLAAVATVDFVNVRRANHSRLAYIHLCGMIGLLIYGLWILHTFSVF